VESAKTHPQNIMSSNNSSPGESGNVVSRRFDQVEDDLLVNDKEEQCILPSGFQPMPSSDVQTTRHPQVQAQVHLQTSSRMTQKKRGPNFSLTEVEHMLDVVEKHMPLGGEMWEKVANEHALSHPSNERDAASVKKKFQDLHKKKIPTGDPNIPREVRRAKLIQQKILAANAAADISQENGGIQGVVTGIARARANVAAGAEQSESESSRLDGTQPMTTRRRSPNHGPQDFMQMFLMQQQMQAERDREERRESREMWMGLLAAVIC